MLKIDTYNHFYPAGYWDKMLKAAPHLADMGKRTRNIRMINDLDFRFEIMDRHDEYKQILSLPAPPPESMTDGQALIDLIKAGNDGLAELCEKHPDRFAGFVAATAPTEVEAGIEEINRAVNELNACGVQIYTNVNDRPWDDPAFEPILAAMHEIDLPVWVHPTRKADHPDYLSEDKSRYEIWWTLGWPYETSVFMARLVFSGLMDKYEGLKIITHHMGGMIPYFEGRVGPGWDQLGTRTSDEDYTQILKNLKKPHLDYFKDFYADTAVFGAEGATECGLKFYGADHVLFASDAPFDPEPGQYMRDTIAIIDNLDISEAERAKIYHGNIERLTKRRFG